MSNLKVISLFSGCGGLDIGAYLAGVETVSCLEIDDDCVSTLRMNQIFQNTMIFKEDITLFSTIKLKNMLKEEKVRDVIVIGGPPCQPFSKAGYWIGHSRRKGIMDERNLVDEFLRIVRDIKPVGFILENVESILHPKHKIVVDNLVSRISMLGYEYKLIKASALDFGVPQRRNRVFIIGLKGHFKINEPKKTHCSLDKTKEMGLKPYEAVGKFIEKYDRPEFFEKEEVTEHGTYGKELKEIPPGKNYFALSERDNPSNPRFKANKRFWSFLLKLHPGVPSWTIAAQPGPWVGPFHWTSRRLRVPEIAAIQTFPENYRFFGTRRSIQKQIGNAVPPLLAKAIVSFLKENL